MTLIYFLAAVVIIMATSTKIAKILVNRTKEAGLVLTLLAAVFITILLAGCVDISSKTTTDKSKPKGTLTVHFIDVGQADATLLEFPSGQTMLIDGGNKSDGALLVDYINKQGIKRIDHVIGTHPHQDHIGGLGTILDNIAVDRIYMPKVVHTTNTYRDLLLTIKEKGLKVTTARAGLELEVGSEAQAVMLSPGSEKYDQINDYSAVLKVTHGAISFLFTGDAEAVAEKEMLESGYDLHGDVLKVGHHGSNTSTTKEFLKAVSPQYAVISCGVDNSYGHPHKEVLARLESAGVNVYRTDLAGTMVATSNGKVITWEKQSSPVQERAPNTAAPTSAGS